MSDEGVRSDTAGQLRCPHCGTAHPVEWIHCPISGKPLFSGAALVGRVIASRYRVVGILAEGGMGTVYAAENVLTHRQIAIKRLHPELARDAANVERFQREAKAAATLGHHNIVEVIETGLAEDGAPFLAMEYLVGETLAAALRREGRLAPSRAVYVMGQVLSALETVHKNGIVHRDLKPDNIFLTRRGGRADFVKILDFGVSKFQSPDGGEASALTRTGMMVGTPHYISPEQARGSRAHDHRVDIYAAGVILYECLTGRLPFDGANYNALIQAIIAGNAQPIRAIVPTVPEAISAVVTKAMARTPSERFSSAAEMFALLSPYGALSTETDPLASQRSTTGSVRPTPLRTPIASPAQRKLPSGEAPAAPVVPPRALASHPRHFVAQSLDWPAEDPLPELGPPSSATNPVRPITRPSIPVAPGDEDERVEGPRIMGAFVGAALYGLRETHGLAGLERILSTTPPESAKRLRGALVTVPWVDARLLIDVAESADALFGDASGSVACAIGRFVAQRTLGSTHRHLVVGANPSSALARLPKIWSAFHDGGELTVTRLGAHDYQVQVTGAASHCLAHARVMLGFYIGMLELLGARDARGDILTAGDLGASRTVTTLSFH